MNAIIDKYIPYGYRIIHGGHTVRQEPLSAGDIVIAVGNRWPHFERKLYFKVAKAVTINGEVYYYLTDGSVFSHEQYERLYMNYDHVFVTGDISVEMFSWQSSHYTYRGLENIFNFSRQFIPHLTKSGRGLLAVKS